MKTKIALLVALIAFSISSFGQEPVSLQKGMFFQVGTKAALPLNIEQIPSVDEDSQKRKASMSSAVVDYEAVVGYFIFPRMSLGLGLGYSTYYQPDLKTIPLAIDLKLYNKDAPQSLFIGVRYAEFLSFNGRFEQGQSATMGVGFKKQFNNQIGLIAQSALEIARVDQSPDGRVSTQYYDFINLAITVGVIF